THGRSSARGIDGLSGHQEAGVAARGSHGRQRARTREAALIELTPSSPLRSAASALGVSGYLWRDEVRRTWMQRA
ncbi:MAG TPA: hypothetical protein VLM11_18805, partial [Streptosporangiaceae bacterium]|nr:hypothetical protein [Streptosporangiaceae bacterium]